MFSGIVEVTGKIVKFDKKTFPYRIAVRDTSTHQGKARGFNRRGRGVSYSGEESKRRGDVRCSG